MPPDEPNAEEKLEQLPEDYDTPFTPSNDAGDSTHPETDTNVDMTEFYQEGVNTDSVQTTNPHPGDVGAYRPDEDNAPKDSIEDETL